jgi:cation transport ATPase
MSLRLLLPLVGVVLLTLAAPAVAGAYVECSSCEAVNGHQNEEAVRRDEEKEKAAKEQKAAEERTAAEERSRLESAERQHHEEVEQAEKKRSEKEAGERKRAKEAVAMVCVVPSLRGDSLSAAREALRDAHCKLGSVTVAIPRGYHGRNAVVVQGQSVRRGTRHPDRTTVAITLGPDRAKSN